MMTMNRWTKNAAAVLFASALFACKGADKKPEVSAEKVEKKAETADTPAAGKAEAKPSESGPIKVGILHSLSGTMAISETSLKDVALMTIKEINAKGGVLGRQLEAVVVDPASD